MRVRAVAIALAVLASSTPAAARCPDGTSVETATARARALRQRLEHEEQRLASWRTTWIALFTAGTAGQIALGEIAGEDDRPTFYVGAIKAALGAASTPILSARFSVPAPVADPCAELAQLQLALVEAARRERKGVAWTQHLPGLGVNVVGVLYLGLAHDLWVESLLGAAFGTLVGSIKVLTQPRRAPDWLARGLPGEPPWISELSFSIGPNHVGLSLRF